MIKARNDITMVNSARRNSDILGLCFFFIGAASLLWLTMPQGGLMPSVFEKALLLFAGTGAFVIPIIMMFVGSMFLIGFERLQFSHSTYGSILFFLTFVAWRHVGAGVTAHELSITPIGYDARWGEAHLMASGGYLGGVLGTIFLKLLGTGATYLFLTMSACISAVLIFDKPFLEMLKHIQRPAIAGMQATKAGAVVALKKTNEIRARRASAKEAAEDQDEEDEVGVIAPASLAKRGKGLMVLRKGQLDASDDAPVPFVRNMPEDDEVPVRKGPRGAKFEQVSPATKKDQLTLNVEIPTTDNFKLPPVTLLRESAPPVKRNKAEIAEKIATLERTFDDFGIKANVVEIASGPSVTRYEIQLAPGTKVSKIVKLADDLAYALAAIDVRVEAPIPGKSAIGVEVPNGSPVMVTLRECIDDPDFWNAPSKLTFCLGKDVSGVHRYADLTKMPHLLVAGSTNSGKSVCLNVIIASLLYRASPREVQFLMIDPKRVELSLWDGIPHLMHPVVKDVKMAAGIFRAAIKEMDRRYDLFASLGTKNLEGYNQKVMEDEKLSFLVIVVDELADLMMQMGAEVEQSICRLAQLARATGIHLVIATQRPSVDVITGLIKANISSRISFAVSSQIDSRTVLDMTGAERLVGKGDMLYMPIDAAKPLRVQGCYISEQETHQLVAHLKEQERPNYTITAVEIGQSTTTTTGSGPDDEDELFETAVKLVVTNGQASTSTLQRRFKIGYNRAARLIDMMEDRRIVGALDGAKPREILMSRDEVDRMFMQDME